MADASRLAWLMAGRIWPKSIGLGVLAALGQAPVGLPFATLLALGLIFRMVLRTGAARQAGMLGWQFGFGYFALSLFWIVEPFFVDPWRHGWMAPFALAGMAAGLALFWAAAFGLARRLGSEGWRAGVGFAVALALAEAARSYVLTGFPWALIGHVWVGWAPMQLAAWVGPIGLSLLTVLAVSLAVALGRRGVWVAVPGLAVWAIAALLAAQPVPEGPGKVVRLVQPNAAQHLKWHPDHVMGFFERQEDYTAAAAERRPDLIIWPETSVPAMLSRAGPAFERIAAAADGVPVVLGIQRIGEAGAMNSLVVLDGQGELADIYDKYHLVPFGEYIPLDWLLGYTPLAGFVQDHGFGYVPGQGPKLVDLGTLGRALPLICYEAIFPQDVRAAPERPGWLLQITNDAWFGELSGPYQHLAQARLRAVEMGLPMVRVANTGVSAVIDARGAVVASIPLGEAGYMDAELPGALPATPYARIGDLPLVLLLLAVAFGIFATRRVKFD